MKSTLFVKEFYLDGLRRLRTSGIVYAFIAAVFTALPVILSGSAMGDAVIFNIVFILNIFMFVGPLTMVFGAFSFLFRRSSSDVFHALPLTRTGLYFSLCAAVLTWEVCVVAAGALAASLSMLLCGWPLNIGYVLLIIAGYSIGALLVTACALIGVSSTGRRFPAFIAAGLVLFLPRFISALASMLVSSTQPMLLPNEMGLLFNAQMNIPTSMFIGQYATNSMLGGMSTESIFLSATPHIYTLLLGLIYLAVGAYLFHRRASETAQSPAPNRIVQHIYRCLLSMPLVLWLCAVTLLSGRGGSFDKDMFIVLLVVTLIVYFLYELMTTKKWKNLLGALYVFPILVVASLIIIQGTIMYADTEAAALPAAEQIKSTQVYSTAYGGYGTMPYQDLLAREVQIADSPELNRIVAESVSYSYKSREKLSPDFILRLNLNDGRTLTRRLAINPPDAERFRALLWAYPAYLEASAALPMEQEISLLYADDSRYMPEDVEAGALAGLWAQYRAELGALPAAERAEILKDGNVRVASRILNPDGEAPYFSDEPAKLGLRFMVQGSRKGVSFRNEYPLTQSTPICANLVMRYGNAQAEKNLAEIQQRLFKGELYWVDFNFQLCNVDWFGQKQNSEMLSGSFSGNTGVIEEKEGGLPAAKRENYQVDEDRMRALFAYLLSLDLREPDISAPFVQFNASAEYEHEGGMQWIALPTVYAAADDAVVKELLAMSGYADSAEAEIPEKYR